MLHYAKHITLKCSALVLIVALLLPLGIKFAHTFEDHTHEVCTDYSSTHLHEIDLDCEFYDFNTTTFTYFLYNSVSLFKSIISTKPISYYTTHVVNAYKHSNRQLRAPPIFLYV